MLQDQIVQLVSLIDQITENIVRGNISQADGLRTMLPALLTKVFPAIVESYSQKELEAVSEEREYWAAQLERIIEVMTGKDSFALVDVLRFETKANLLYYKEMTEKAGLII